jgi:hypothetical protein
MSPKKRLGKDYSAEGSSHVPGGQVLKITTQPQASMEPHPAMSNTRRSGEPPEQLVAQAETPPTNTFAPSTQPPIQHQETKTQEDQQQDSDE